jgi:hypothetical protein
MRRFSFLIFAFLLAGCAADAAVVMDERFVDNGEMGDSFGDGVLPAELFVDPAGVQAEREAFVEALKRRPRNDRRGFYAEHIDEIGANGVLDGIENLWPTCHAEAHDLGKVIYERVKNVGLGLQICADGCYSGCMHGVLMEAFTGLGDPNDPDGHVEPAKLAALMDTICYKTESMQESYSPGDCAHGIGHALMVLADYDVDASMKYCDEFDTDPMRYYCATGAYMEYVTENDDEDSTTKPALYPCDTGKYPAACTRYKMVHVIGRLVKKASDVRKMMRSCDALKGPLRLACYHGAGNGFMGPIVSGQLALKDVCGTGTDDDRVMCIEGAMERIAKFYPDRAREICSQAEGVDRATCERAVEQGMYNMEKDFRLYVGT